jgi:hypothetical protein
MNPTRNFPTQARAGAARPPVINQHGRANAHVNNNCVQPKAAQLQTPRAGQFPQPHAPRATLPPRPANAAGQTYAVRAPQEARAPQGARTPQETRTPRAPAVYSPQTPAPHVLQPKAAAARPPHAQPPNAHARQAQATAAPPVYRPNPLPHVLQMKEARAGFAPFSQTKATPLSQTKAAPHGPRAPINAARAGASTLAARDLTGSRPSAPTAHSHAAHAHAAHSHAARAQARPSHLPTPRGAAVAPRAASHVQAKCSPASGRCCGKCAKHKAQRVGAHVVQRRAWGRPGQVVQRRAWGRVIQMSDMDEDEDYDPNDEPAGCDDTQYVDDDCDLKHPYYTDVRRYFYPSGYRAATDQWAEERAEELQGDCDDGEFECPDCEDCIDNDNLTIEHLQSVVQHWNATGHNESQLHRANWYNDTSNMDILCQPCNSRRGGGAVYQHNVGTNFSGPNG